MASHTSTKEARSRAVTKFMKKNYDALSFKVTKESGIKQKVTDHAKKMGETRNAFIKRAVLETIENDNKKTQ